MLFAGKNESTKKAFLKRQYLLSSEEAPLLGSVHPCGSSPQEAFLHLEILQIIHHTPQSDI